MEFIIFSIGYFIVAWSLKRVDWPRLWHHIDRWIFHRYITKLIVIDGNYYEKLGTGKMIAVLNTGAKTWIEGVINLIKE